MNIPVEWLSFHKDVTAHGQWDDAFLDDLFEGKFGDLGYELTESDHVDGEGAVVIIHARHHADDTARINKYLTTLTWALVILVGDEASVFPYEKLKHENMRSWVMHPAPQRHDEATRYLINGYPPQIHDFKEKVAKEIDYYFAGQINHRRRHEMIAAMSMVNGLSGQIDVSSGFAQGLDHDEYYQNLARAKIALCPSGPETPDTFRVWEALELGCVPIVERLPSREGYPDGFWEYLLGEAPPFVFIDSWDGIEKLLPAVLRDWKGISNRCSAWWKQRKRQYVKELQADLFHLSGVEP